ncbi:MAG TPA: ABC transporter substrate-binding protein [bacterium]|nr:ABC transporter substrate-binding protein [bacterium]
MTIERLRAGMFSCLAIALLACPAALGAAPPIHVGYLGTSGDAGIFIALDKGYFAEQGLTVSPERFGVGADQMALLGAGRLDVASGAPSPTLFNAVSRGLPISVVADKGSLRKGFGFNVLVVRKALIDSGQFKGLSDLRGRVIAAPTASVVNFEDYLILKKGGLTPRDVTIEDIGFQDQPAAMANGRIDAAVMVEPFGTATESRGVGKIVMTLDQLLPDFQVALIYYNTSWARAHSEDARRWMIAYVKALRYYNAALHSPQIRDDVITILAAHTPIKERAVYDKMVWPGFNPDGAVTWRGLLDYERWLLNEHQITEFVAPARFLDQSYVENAVKTLGPIRP